jgi:damage-control phosphatase, subfamily I
METSVGCLMCFFRQIERTSEMVGLSRRAKEKLYYKLTRELLKFDFRLPSVIYGRKIYRAIGDACGRQDIFYRQKLMVERRLASGVVRLKRMISDSFDPMHAAARFSCAANSIDFGAGKAPDVGRLLEELRDSRLDVDHYKHFLRLFHRARTVMFLGDNCGETFFDRFLIEEMRRVKADVEIFYAVRQAPIINDVTMIDAKRAGLDKVSRLISSGSDSPGLIFSETSEAFRRLYRRSDIIISKGQGNFEAFEDAHKDVFYLFKVKCFPVAQYVGRPENSLLFLYNRSGGS